MAKISKKSKDNIEEEIILLEKIQCIYYLFYIQKDKESNVQALINLGSKVNAMILAYTNKLGLKIYSTIVGAQKKDGSLFQTFKIILASFHIVDKLERAQFFEKNFLLANTNVEVVLSMLFLTLSNSDIQFTEKKLTQKSYIAAKTLSITKQMKLINKKNFAKAMLDEQ